MNKIPINLRPKIRIRRPRIRIKWRQKTSRWVLILAACFFAGLFVLHIFLLRQAKSIIIEALDNKVVAASGGIYHVSFDDIAISYTKQQITIKNLKLLPDSVEIENLIRRGKKPKTIYSVNIPELFINDFGLRKAYLNRVLAVDQLIIRDASVLIDVDYDTPTPPIDSVLRKDIKRQIAPFFKEVEAKIIVFPNLSVRLKSIKNGERTELRSDNTLLQLDDLKLKTQLSATDKKFIKLADIRLRGSQLEGVLSDSLYIFNLSKFELGKRDSVLYLENLSVLPSADATRLAERRDDIESIYEIRVPQVYGYGIDYDNVYNQRNLDLDELTLLSPELILLNIKAETDYEREPFKPQDLYEAIDRVLNRLTIKQLGIRYGKSTVSQKFDNQVLTKFATTIREASIFNFRLDSLSLSRNDQLFFSDSILVDLKDYQLRLGDNVHLLTASNLRIDSRNKQILGKNFALVADTTSTAIDTTEVRYAGNVDVLNFKGIDINQLYNYNRLIIDSINLENPKFEYSRVMPKTIAWDTTDKKFRQSDVYTLISDYLYELNVGYLDLYNGSVEIDEVKIGNNDVFTTKLHSAKLWNFQIDSTSAYKLKKLFNADDFELDIQDYKHHLPDGIHTIVAASLLVSTKQDKIILQGIQISNKRAMHYPFTSAGTSDLPLTLLDIQVDKLELLGVDVLEAYLNKRLVVDEVTIPSPIIKIGSRLLPKEESERKGIVSSRVLYTLMQPYLTQLSVGKLSITDAEVGTAFHAPNGSLLLNSAGTDIVITTFRFDSISSRNAQHLFFAEDVKVVSNKLAINPADSRYQLQIERLSTSTSSGNIIAENVNLSQPEANISDEFLLLKDKKGLLRFNLPEVRITGVDFDRAYYEERLFIDSILTDEPNVVYHFASTPIRKKAETKRISLQETNLYEVVSPFMSAIQIAHIVIKKGDFKTNHTSRTQLEDRLKLTNVSLTVDGFRLDSSAAVDTKRFFYSDDMRLHIDRYAFPLSDGIHDLSARNLEVSTRNNLVILSDVRLQPKLVADFSQLTSNRYTARVPEVIMAGVNFDGIFDGDKLEVQKVDVIGPTIDIRINQKPKSGTDTKKDQKLNMSKADLNSIAVLESNIVGAQIRYVQYSSTGSKSEINFPNVSANITDMRYDMLSTEDNPPFYAENFILDVAGWKTLLPDSMHYIEPEQITFSATDSLLTAHNLKIYPRTDAKPDFSKTQYVATIPQVLIEGVNINQLQNDTLDFNHIRVLLPELETFSYKDVATVAKPKQIAYPKPIKVKPSFNKVINIDSISVLQARLKSNTVLGTDTTGIELNHVYLKAKGIRVDSALLANDKRILFSDNIRFGIRGHSFRTDDGMYDISIQEVGLNTENSTLWVDSLRIIPAMDRDAFAAAKGYETDQFTFINKRLELQDIDLRRLIYNNELIVKRLLVDGFNLGVYRDKRQPYPEGHVPPMPQTSLRNSKLGILIKESTLINGYIGYSERVKGSGRTGFIDLTGITLTADTISNFESVLSQNYVTNLHASMDIMGAGHLEADFNIPFGDSLNRHTYSGHLTQMKLEELNPILENTIFVKISSGEVDSIAFFVNADMYSADGFMEFGYHDLKVSLVSKQTGNPVGLFRQVGSSVANLFVKDENTGELEDGTRTLRQGEIKYKRNEERSIVNYWVKTLVDGFKSSIGL